MSRSSRKSCVICAWRENCVKKFSVSSGLEVNCIEFERDVTLKFDDEKETEKKSK